jgi:hypothetical protein
MPHHARFPFTALSQLEGEGGAALVLTTTSLTQLKARGEDHPYTVLKATPTTWRFSLTYAKLDACLPLVQQYLAASRLPPPDRWEGARVGGPGRENQGKREGGREEGGREGGRREGEPGREGGRAREVGRAAAGWAALSRWLQGAAGGSLFDACMTTGG